MKKVLFLTTALIMSAMMWAGETKTLIIDGSQLTSTATSAVTDFTYGDFTIAMSDGAKFQASSGDNRFEGTDKAILIGKSGKYIYNKTPFGKITKFEIYANKGASAKVSVGVLFSTTAISSYSEGANTYTATLSTLDNVYDCSANIPDGAQYFWYQVTNAYNSQVMFRITYEDGGTPQRTLESIYIAGEAENLEYFVGEEFDHAGLKVMGVYDDELGDAEITSGITWSYNPEVFALGNTFVDVLAQYKDFTSEVFTVNNIVVKEFVKTYANTYTSNVELSTDGGTSASEAKVIIDETEYDAIKAGTGKVTGACVVTIPANTKTLHFHAAGWKGETVVLNETFELVADAGVSNNSPFTLSNDPETQDYFTLDPKGATSITFTATSGNRFVLFGVNAEIGTPTAMQEVMENANVSKQLINGQLIIIRDNVRYNVAGQQL